MRDPDAQTRPRRALLAEGAHELHERLLVAADALDGHDLSFRDGQDRLHVEHLAGERLRPPDPAAAREELERVDREEEPRVAAVARPELVDLPLGRAPLEAPVDGQA